MVWCKSLALLLVLLASVLAASPTDAGLIYFIQPTRYAEGTAPGEPLKTAWNIVDGLDVTFTVDQTSRVTILGHVGYQAVGASGRVMIATDIWVNGVVGRDAAPDGVGFHRTNNLERGEHYLTEPLTGVLLLEPGEHHLAIVAYCKRLSGDVWGYVKAPQYSGVWVIVEPA